MPVRTVVIGGGSKLHSLPAILAVLGLLTVWGCTKGESPQDMERSGMATRDAAPTPTVMGPEDADHLWVFAESEDRLGSGGEFRIFVDPENFPEASASFAKFGLGVGGALPIHRHDKTEEIGYFLSGEGVVTVFQDGTPEDIPVREGFVTYIPPGSWHTIKNTGNEPFTLVFATIPNEKKGLLSLFRRIGSNPGEPTTELSADEFARLAAEHDFILRQPDAGK